MLEVKAYVRENMLDKVVDKLSEIPGVPGIMVGEVIGCQDQCSFFLLAKLNDDLSALEEKLGTGSSGQTAPSLIHFSKSLTPPLRPTTDWVPKCVFAKYH